MDRYEAVFRCSFVFFKRFFLAIVCSWCSFFDDFSWESSVSLIQLGRKNFLRLGVMAAGLAFVILLSGCGGGSSVVLDKPGTALFTTAGASVSVDTDATAIYTIGGGGGGGFFVTYTALSSDKGIAEASVDGSKLVVKGIKGGTAVVTVTDSSGATVKITVNVTGGGSSGGALSILAPANIGIGVGSNATYKLNGGTGPYIVVSSNVGVAVARLLADGNSLLIDGVASGAAQISVFDSRGATAALVVTIGSGRAAALFTSAASAVTLVQGFAAQYRVGGGSSGYAVTSSNPLIVSAAITGTTLTLTPVAIGTSRVTITDAENSSIMVSVTVTGTSSLSTTVPGEFSIALGDASESYAINGGVAPYQIVSNSPSVAIGNLSGDRFSILGVGVGNALLTVSDSLGNTSVVTVSVVAQSMSTALFTTAPSSVVISTLSGVINYQVSGGVGPYTVSSSNEAVVQTTISGKSFGIIPKNIGTANVVVKDSVGGSVQIAVTANNNPVSSPFYTTAPSSVIVRSGIASIFSVSGGIAPYSVRSVNSAIATAVVLGNTLNITGMGVGSTVLVIQDSSSASISINITTQ